MPFWRGETLLAIGDQLIEPFDKNQIDCNAYTLRMGGQYYKTVDTAEESADQKKTFLSSRESFIIPAGQFAFLLSKETIHVPNSAMAFISMRTGIKFQGLINVSGFHVDPGYSGKLVYAVYNASPSPIQLAEDDLIFKVWFCSLDDVSSNPYVKQPTDALTDITNDMLRGMNREILSLQNLAKKIRDQEHDVEKRFLEQKPIIEQLYFIWRALILAVLAAAVLALFAVIFPPALVTGQALATWITPYVKKVFNQSENNATPKPNQGGNNPPSQPPTQAIPTPSQPGTAKP